MSNAILRDPPPEAPPGTNPKRPCEFTPRQRLEFYKTLLKLHDTIQHVPCAGVSQGRALCPLHSAAINTMAPLVTVLAGGDQTVVVKLMELHKRSSPGISMPNLLKKVAAALVEGSNGTHG